MEKIEDCLAYFSAKPTTFHEKIPRKVAQSVRFQLQNDDKN